MNVNVTREEAIESFKNTNVLVDGMYNEKDVDIFVGNAYRNGRESVIKEILIFINEQQEGAQYAAQITPNAGIVRLIRLRDFIAKIA